MNAPRILGLAAVAVAAVLALPAGATSCVGEQSTAYVCVTPPGIGLGSTPLCVYAGGDTCKPVDVPTPVLTGCPSAGWGGALPSLDPNLITYQCDLGSK